jgi:uncharacterized protein
MVPLQPASIELLIVQASPFCNIDCDYCYLPHRSDTRRIDVPTVQRVIKSAFDNKLVGESLTVVWHAGESLAVPLSFYESVLAAIDALDLPEIPIIHHFQTNGMLLDESWCKFIERNGIRVGVSIDGPADLHDRHRKDRLGRGTHSQTMRGIQKLRDYDIPFHIIAVITKESLSRADDIFDFFATSGAYQVGFNIEEQEGIHTTSSLKAQGTDETIRLFWQRLYKRYKNGEAAFTIREFDRACHALAVAPVDTNGFGYRNCQVVPLSIVSVDSDGNISTFSPELLGTKSDRFGHFIFGNINSGDIASILNSDSLRAVTAEIENGIRECERVCQYFKLCGGGAPSNKYGEHGSFASAETMYCRHTIKAPLDVVLTDLEEALQILPAGKAIRSTGVA